MTSPQPYCIHECVCSFYKARNGELGCEPCDLNTKDACPHSSAAGEAEKVLDELDKRCYEAMPIGSDHSDYAIRMRVVLKDVRRWITELRQQGEREQG